jgi:membrane protein implicated in regulation of membrane protease activity
MDQGLLWFVAGAILMIAELFLPGFIAVFFGFGAVVTGLAIWMGLPTEGGWPFLLFSAVTIVSIAFMRTRFQQWFTGKQAGDSESTPDTDFLGREAIVLEGFGNLEPHRGMVEYRGSRWSARSEGVALAIGDRVVITAQEGLTLTVKKLESN